MVIHHHEIMIQKMKILDEKNHVQLAHIQNRLFTQKPIYKSNIVYPNGNYMEWNDQDVKVSLDVGPVIINHNHFYRFVLDAGIRLMRI